MLKVSDIFEVTYGVNLELNALRQEPDGINFVSRSLSTKQAIGLVRPSLLYGRCQAIMPFSADDASMPQILGER